MSQMFWVVIGFLLALFAIGLCYIQIHEKPHKSAQPEKGEIIARGCVGRAVQAVPFLGLMLLAIELDKQFHITKFFHFLLPVEYTIAVLVALGGYAGLLNMLDKRILRRWKVWRLMHL